MEPVLKLLEFDIQTPSPDPRTWDELLADCHGCVGPARQMLETQGVTDPKVLELSDTACAAALLTRLWQDVRVDVFNKGHVFIPRDIAARHGLDLSLMVKAVKLDTDRGCEGNQRTGSCDCASMPRAGMLALRKPYRTTMGELAKRTEPLFIESRAIYPNLPPELRRAYRRMAYEARATLGMIAWGGYDTLTRRPKLNALRRAWVGMQLRFSR